MAANEQQDKTLSELVVKELVKQGMNSSVRDSIVEGVEASEGAPSRGSRRLPIAGALFGLGAAIGFLAGRESSELEDVSLEDVQEPEIIEDVTDEIEESISETETEPEMEDSGSSSRLGRLLLVVGVLVGVAVLRRRFASEEDEEWEPIEEFEPATDLGSDEDESEAETEESDEDIEDVEEAEADAGEETEE